MAGGFGGEEVGQAHPLLVDEVGLHALKRQRRGVGQAVDQGRQLGLELGLRRKPVHQPDPRGLGGVELAGQEVELARLGRADDARQEPGPGHVAGHAHVQERHVEAGGLVADAQVAGAGPAEPGAGASALIAAMVTSGASCRMALMPNVSGRQTR